MQVRLEEVSLQEDREVGKLTTRKNIRDLARKIMDVADEARLELGPRPSLAKLAYFVTGKGIFSPTGKRWGRQTIEPYLYIDTMHRTATEVSWKKMQAHFAITKEPEKLVYYRDILDKEVAEAEAIATELRRRLGFFAE